MRVYMYMYVCVCQLHLHGYMTLYMYVLLLGCVNLWRLFLLAWCGVAYGKGGPNVEKLVYLSLLFVCNNIILIVC